MLEAEGIELQFSAKTTSVDNRDSEIELAYDTNQRAKTFADRICWWPLAVNQIPMIWSSIRPG